jgi:hypothetical protein
LVFKKIGKVYKPLTKITKKRVRRLKGIELEMRNGTSQELPKKFRGTLRNMLKTCILNDWII